jgi:hypothetical protein
MELGTHPPFEALNEIHALMQNEKNEDNQRWGVLLWYVP